MMRATLTPLLLLPLWPAHARGQNPSDERRWPRGAVVVETRHFQYAFHLEVSDNGRPGAVVQN